MRTPFLFLLFLLLPLFAVSQDRKAALQRLLDTVGIPGFSLVYIHNGAVAESYALGLRSAEEAAAVNEATVFSAASLSKPVFAYALLQLADEGRLDLDRPLAEYYHYPDLADQPGYRKITARHLLSHTSGLPNWRFFGPFEFAFPAGTAFSYSGEGYVWLSRVVEEITGQSTEAFIRERVFLPLGMERSSFIWPDHLEDNFAWPHDHRSRSFPPPRPQQSNVAYSLQTTAADYGRFMLALLKKEGLEKRTFDELYRPQPGSHPDSTRRDLAWGLGIGLAETAAGTSFWQWGDNGTFRGLVVGYPETGDGLVYFTNSRHGLSVMDTLHRMFFGQSYPAFTWLNYAAWDSPPMGLQRALQTAAAAEAVQPLLNGHGQLDTTLINARSANRIAEALYYDGRPEEAAFLFRLIAEVYPRSAWTHEGLGMASLAIGNTDEAARAFSQAAALNPDLTHLQEAAARLHGTYSPPPPDSGYVAVTFELKDYSAARNVQLTGSFNEWSELAHPMQWRRGAWRTTAWLRPGEYQYRFIVDRVQIPDPANPQVGTADGHHSVLRVEPSQ